MKNLLIFFIFSNSILFGQIKLNSHYLELKKSKDFHQILTAKNEVTQEIIIFATDKQITRVIKYNAAIFFKDSLSSTRVDQGKLFMSGYSFDQNQNPIVYWQAENQKKIISVLYDFEKRVTSQIQYNFNLEEEQHLIQFTENNVFYILAKLKNTNNLKLYVFKDNQLVEKILDFSSIIFLSQENKKVTINTLLENFPIEKIESEEFNSLASSNQKTKLYSNKNQIQITFDHNANETQIVTLDLNTYVIQEKKIPQSVLKNSSYSSNSYLLKDKLFQIKNNDKQLNFELKDLQTGVTVQSYSVFEKDTIAFKSSPVFIQNGNHKPKELKTTKKILRKLAFASIGVTAYSLYDTNLIIIGSLRNVSSTGDILFGSSLAIASLLGNDVGFGGDFYENDLIQTTYFESYFTTKFEPVFNKEIYLAFDKISNFIDENKTVRLQNVIKFKNYYILGYYDYKENEYVLRKFTDGNIN